MPHDATLHGMADLLTPDLFGQDLGAGSLAMDLEVKALVAATLHAAEGRGEERAAIARRMSYYAGEVIGVNSLGDWASPAHTNHRISFARAAAFDAAVGGEPLLRLLAAKRGLHVITDDEQVLLELGRLREEERERAEHRRALETLLKLRKKP
jgi:hypothetical protein